MKEGLFRYFHTDSGRKLHFYHPLMTTAEELTDTFAGFLLACGFSKQTIVDNLMEWAEENKESDPTEVQEYSLGGVPI